MREIQIREEESGQRLDKFLRRFLPGAGNGFLYKMLRKKNILLDGRKATGRELLQSGDIVRIYFSEETLRKFQNLPDHSEQSTATLSEDMVVYADKHLLLVNKPAGMLTQRAEKNDSSLIERARNWLLQEGRLSAEDRLLYDPGPANRIDRNTSGLVAIPLTLAAAQQLSGMFRDRTIHKRYLALVAGRYDGPGRQTAWCARDEATRVTTIYFHRQESADRIEMICDPLTVTEDRSLLQVTLVTGKTHQIRSHLQACGFPIIGDPKYGRCLQHANKRSSRSDPLTGTSLNRQFLHAWQLEFPVCSGPLETVSGRVFTAPLPEDLRGELDASGIASPCSAV